MMLVGALFVGSMTTVWHGDITPRRPRRGAELHPDPKLAPLALERGAEMGRFNMGSTVILVLPPGTTQWLAGFQAGSTIRMGQATRAPRHEQPDWRPTAAARALWSSARATAGAGARVLREAQACWKSTRRSS